MKNFLVVTEPGRACRPRCCWRGCTLACLRWAKDGMGLDWPCPHTDGRDRALPSLHNLRDLALALRSLHRNSRMRLGLVTTWPDFANNPVSVEFAVHILTPVRWALCTS